MVWNLRKFLLLHIFELIIEERSVTRTNLSVSAAPGPSPPGSFRALTRAKTFQSRANHRRHFLFFAGGGGGGGGAKECRGRKRREKERRPPLALASSPRAACDERIAGSCYEG